jgi:hypothetical protein
VILDAAPTPAAAATLTVAELAALLRAAGRQRGIAAEADKRLSVHRCGWDRVINRLGWL